jgi:hypothetical protein
MSTGRTCPERRFALARLQSRAVVSDGANSNLGTMLRTSPGSHSPSPYVSTVALKTVPAATYAQTRVETKPPRTTPLPVRRHILQLRHYSLASQLVCIRVCLVRNLDSSADWGAGAGFIPVAALCKAVFVSSFLWARRCLPTRQIERDPSYTTMKAI